MNQLQVEILYCVFKLHLVSKFHSNLKILFSLTVEYLDFLTIVALFYFSRQFLLKTVSIQASDHNS